MKKKYKFTGITGFSIDDFAVTIPEGGIVEIPVEVWSRAEFRDMVATLSAGANGTGAEFVEDVAEAAPEAPKTARKAKAAEASVEAAPEAPKAE